MKSLIVNADEFGLTEGVNRAIIEAHRQGIVTSTTLVPNLGVVKVHSHRSFVIADIPGLIEGASEGAGLGIRFLKHLTRNRILLHIVDMAPYDGTEPAA